MNASAMVDRYRRHRPSPDGSGASGGGPMGELIGLWGTVVGEVGAAHSEPVRRTRAGVVTVACSSSAWAQELTYRRAELLERLRPLLSDPTAVSGLRFSVADHVAEARERERERAPEPRLAPQPNPDDRETGERAADGIDNQDIRDLIARLAANAAARDAGR